MKNFLFLFLSNLYFYSYINTETIFFKLLATGIYISNHILVTGVYYFVIYIVVYFYSYINTHEFLFLFFVISTQVLTLKLVIIANEISIFSHGLWEQQICLKGQFSCHIKYIYYKFIDYQDKLIFL
jgi:hypothetical protein